MMTDRKFFITNSLVTSHGAQLSRMLIVIFKASAPTNIKFNSKKICLKTFSTGTSEKLW